MPYVRGHDENQGPRQFPANEKMWNMYVAQAKARFRVFPSPIASSWVHAQYSRAGGKFVDKQSQVDPRFIDYAERYNDAKREAQQKPIHKKIRKRVKKRNLGGGKFV